MNEIIFEHKEEEEWFYKELDRLQFTDSLNGTNEAEELIKHFQDNPPE